MRLHHILLCFSRCCWGWLLYDGRAGRRGDVHAETCFCITFMGLRSIEDRVVCMYGSRAGRRQGHAGRDMHLRHFGGLVVAKGVVEWVG